MLLEEMTMLLAVTRWRALHVYCTRSGARSSLAFPSQPPASFTSSSYPHLPSTNAPRLSTRLQRLHDCVPLQTVATGNRVVVDMGTDHGLLAAALAARPDIDTVIGTDQSSHGAAHALFNTVPGTDSEGVPLQAKLVMRVGDGFSALNALNALQPSAHALTVTPAPAPLSVDTVILSGMGIHTLAAILSSSGSGGSSGSGSGSGSGRVRSSWNDGPFWLTPAVHEAHDTLLPLNSALDQLSVRIYIYIYICVCLFLSLSLTLTNS